MIGKFTIAMYSCVNSYYISDFELELVVNVLDSVSLYVLFTEQY